MDDRGESIMLLSTQANRYAHQLLAAREEGRRLAPLSVESELSLADGYDIARSIAQIRIAQGEIPVGRKLGFSNRCLWGKYGATESISQPIWSRLFDTTVRHAEENRGIQSLTGAVAPRIAPHILFKLSRTPEPDATLDSIADCIEWIAHGLEIEVCPYPDWRFNAADAVAAFGLHGLLIVGEPVALAPPARHNLAAALANASVSLTCSEAERFSLRAAGFGSDVLDSPVHALLHLHRLLLEQRYAAPLGAGEIIATGALTDAYPVAADQTWSTAFSGVTLPGLTVSFV
jgi:2-keto-4-pentenoate hydratase